MRVAQLALKRRVTDQGNPNRRIIAFVGSPLKESQDELVKLGLRLKKNNIAVDVVNFGEESVNTQKLDAFINSVVSDDNSHLVTIPPGPHLLSDMLLTSPIVQAGGDMGAGMVGGGDMEFPGVDPNLDPDLAMALRISLEEERRRQERVRQQEGDAAEGGTTTEAETQPLLQGGDAMDEDEELRRAIALSLKETGGGDSGTTATQNDAMQQDTDLYEDEEQEMDEDEALRLALAMSQQQSGGDKKDDSDFLHDEEYMSDLLQNLGGDEEKRKKEEEERKKREGK